MMIRSLRTRADLVMGLTLAGPSQSHISAEVTQPAGDAVLDASPEAIHMTSNTPKCLTMIKLSDGAGGTHDLARTDNMEPVIEITGIPAVLPAGLYWIEWRRLLSEASSMKGIFSLKFSG